MLVTIYVVFRVRCYYYYYVYDDDDVDEVVATWIIFSSSHLIFFSVWKSYRIFNCELCDAIPCDYATLVRNYGCFTIAVGFLFSLNRKEKGNICQIIRFVFLCLLIYLRIHRSTRRCSLFHQAHPSFSSFLNSSHRTRIQEFNFKHKIKLYELCVVCCVGHGP